MTIVLFKNVRNVWAAEAEINFEPVQVLYQYRQPRMVNGKFSDLVFYKEQPWVSYYSQSTSININQHQ